MCLRKTDKASRHGAEFGDLEVEDPRVFLALGVLVF